MTHQTEAGRKAQITRRFQWGPDEQNRAARQAAWTGDNPDRPRDGNPHIREAVYTTADFERVARFKAWAKVHPTAHPSENPEAHPATAA